jgi:hypothetical protein
MFKLVPRLLNVSVVPRVPTVVLTGFIAGLPSDPASGPATIGLSGQLTLM